MSGQAGVMTTRPHDDPHPDPLRGNGRRVRHGGPSDAPPRADVRTTGGFENPAVLIVVDQPLRTAMHEPREALLSISHGHLLAQP